MEYESISSSVGSCLSCCQRGEEVLLGVRTGYGRDCHIDAAFGPPVSAGSGGGVWGGAVREVHWGLDQVGKLGEVMLELG